MKGDMNNLFYLIKIIRLKRGISGFNVYEIMNHCRRMHLKHIQKHLAEGKYFNEITTDLNIMEKNKTRIDKLIYQEFYLRVAKLVVLIATSSYCFALIFKIVLNFEHDSFGEHDPDTVENPDEYFHYAYLEGNHEYF